MTGKEREQKHWGKVLCLKITRGERRLYPLEIASEKKEQSREETRGDGRSVTAKSGKGGESPADFCGKRKAVAES